MFNSPNDNLDQIDISKKFIDDLWDSEKAMQDTINTEHPDFRARKSDEYDCWVNHEQNMMRLEKISRQLDRLKEYATQRYANKIQIPHG